MKNKNFLLFYFIFLGINFFKAQCDPVVWYQTEDKRLYTANLSTGVSTQICSNLQSPVSSDTMTDIAFSPNGNLYAVCNRSADNGRLYLINTGTCGVQTLTRTGSVAQAGIRANSLTFLPDGTALVGYNDTRQIQRITIISSTQYTLENWYMPSGSGVTGAGGDFILLGDKLYASMLSSNDNVVFEISVDENYNAVSTLGSYSKSISPEGMMFGMAAVYGKIYGGFAGRTIRELTLSGSTVSYSSNLLSSLASQEIWGMTSTQEALGQTNPTIRSNPTNTIICPGGNVVLTSSVASGNQWYRNGVAIPGATLRRYTATTAGVYSVRVTYGSGCVTDFSNTITVTLSDLTVTNQPLAADYCQNDTAAALSVAISGGTGAISYQWYRNTANSNSGGVAVGGNSSTYTPILTSSVTYFYYAVVTRGTCTVTSNPARITSTAKPTTPTVVGGSSLSNSCPTTTVNLTALQPAAVSGQTYEWHSVSTNPSAGTLVANPSAVANSGSYYLYSKTNTGGCYSNASNTVSVTINDCGNCPLVMANLTPYNNGTAKSEDVFASNNIRIGNNRLSLTNTTTLAASLFTPNRISDDHYTGETGIQIGHNQSSGLPESQKIVSTLSFDTPISFLSFTISDIDYGDRVRVNAYDENNILITLAPANYSIYNPANVGVSGNSFYDAQYPVVFQAPSGTRDGTVNVNFYGKKVSRVVFEFTDDAMQGAYTISKIAGEYCAVCYEDPTIVTGAAYPVKHGITILGRAGKTSSGTNDTASDWPMNKNSAYTALESKTKGFVITRNANPETTIATPVVGMMVFDTDADSGKGCLKIYTGPSASEGWKCFTNQTCP